MKKDRAEKKKKWEIWVLRPVAWFIIWEIAELIIGKKVPFAGPFDTAVQLYKDILDITFWRAIGNTFMGISFGFVTALVLGTVLAYVAYYHKTFDGIFTPIMDFFRYIPMITFTLLAILWSSSSALAWEVCLFLSIPTIYKNTLLGLNHSNRHTLMRIAQMDMPVMKKLNVMFNPAAMPDYIAGCHRALNMCWKSGIIAQFLGDTKHSIGSSLFVAKETGNVAQIFSWTIVIVLLSVLFEKVVIRILSMAALNPKYASYDKVQEVLEEEDIQL